MKVYFEQLLSQVARTLVPVYLLMGEEPFLLEEAATAIRAKASAAGFARERFFEERQFEWGIIQQKSQSLALFADKQLLEVQVTSGKITDKGAKVIIEYCANPPADKILLLIAPHLEKDQARTAWYKALDKIGLVTTVYPIDRERLPQWIAKRVEAYGLRLNKESILLLAERHENDLTGIV